MNIYLKYEELKELSLYSSLTSPFYQINKIMTSIDLLFLSGWKNIEIGEDVFIFSDILESGYTRFFKKHDIRIESFVKLIYKYNNNIIELPDICIIECGYDKELEKEPIEKIKEYIQPENDWRILDDLCRIDKKLAFEFGGEKTVIRVSSKIKSGNKGD